MRLIRMLVIVLFPACLAACGGSAELTCDDVKSYQLASEGRRVVAPDDLDDLEPLREMPLPEASPRPPRPDDAPCLEAPPAVRIEK